jgi:hypothetical protein
MPGITTESAVVQIGDRVVAIDDVPVETRNGLLLRSTLESEHAAGSLMTFSPSSTADAPRLRRAIRERNEARTLVI